MSDCGDEKYAARKYKAVMDILLSMDAFLTKKGEAEPVYNANWLNQIIQPYVLSLVEPWIVAVPYGCFDPVRLDTKTSATIILSAIAKHLNGDKKGEWAIRVTNEGDYYHSIYVGVGERYGQPLFKNGQKAIDILTKHFPEVLTNYFGI